MVGVRVSLSRLVALSLDGLDVDDDRAARVDGLAHALPQGVHVVPVHDADVSEAQLLEEQPGHEQRLHRLLDVFAETVGLRADGGDARNAPLDVFAQARESRVEADAVEVQLKGADVGADRHLVVVDDHHERGAQMPRLIHRLEGDAAGERAVAEDGDHVSRALAGEPGCLHEPEPVADGSGSVTGPDDVVLGFRAAREAAQAAVLTDRIEAVAPAGEQLVGIALVTHIPDDLVARAVEHAVQRHRELDRAQAGRQVAAHLAHAREDGLPDFPGKKRQFGLCELLEVGGSGDLIEIAHRFSV